MAANKKILEPAVNNGRRLSAMLPQALAEYVESASTKLSRLFGGSKADVSNIPLTPFNQTAHRNGFSAPRNVYSYFNPAFPYQTSQKHSIPPRRVLWFDETTDLSEYQINTDQRFGGSSYAELTVTPHNTLLFSGEIRPMKPFTSTSNKWTEDIATKVVTNKYMEKPQRNSPNSFIQTTQLVDAPATPPTSTSTSSSVTSTPVGLMNGFCAFISPQFEFPDLNLSKYDYLAIQMRTDGRNYIFNLRCDERIKFVYQIRIREEDPNRPLHTKEARFDSFVTTLNGKMSQQNLALRVRKDCIKSFGISLNGPPGPFAIEIGTVEARQGVPAFEASRMTAAELERMKAGDSLARGEDTLLWWNKETDTRVKQQVAKEEARLAAATTAENPSTSTPTPTPIPPIEELELPGDHDIGIVAEQSEEQKRKWINRHRTRSSTSRR